MQRFNYFGSAAALMGANYNSSDQLCYDIRLDALELVNTGGLTEGILVDDIQSEKVILALLNCLYRSTKDRFNEQEYPIIGTSLTAGRLSMPNEDGTETLYDTYDMNFLIRLPSSAGAFPSPEDLY